MKKALLGLSNNITNNISKIKVWSKSFKQHSDGDVVLLCANSNEHEINMCQELGIITIPVTIEDTYYINHKRLGNTLEFLKTTDIDLFLITDVFDVVFQSDPFIKMDLNYDIFVGSEGLKLSQEPWNADVINKVFPDYFGKCLDQDIICSGVIGGKREALINLYDKLYSMCENSLNGHNIKDQAALIIAIFNNEIENLKIFEVTEGWTLHCALGGPTQFFDSWGLKNNLVSRHGGVAKLDGDEIFTHTGLKYDIVHQFNRIPEWNELLTKEYE
jgi:hypothetical protein